MGTGGAERVASTLCNAWSAMGRQVTLVITYSGRGECFYDISDSVRIVYLADLVNVSSKSMAGYLSRFISLRGLLKKDSPDVVVSFLTNVNIAAICATLGLGIPVIACERTNPVADTMTGSGYRWLRWLIYPLADMVTVQSRMTADAFRKTMPPIKRLEVIANPIPSALTEPICRDKSADGRLRLIAMGRLSDEKQFQQLIEKFSAIAASLPAWDLWIWGEGPKRAQLENRISALGLNDRVKLPGRTLTPWEELAKSHVFVLCSAFEGFPNVLLEAMALGLPCVTFDCPSGPREISRDGRDALLVPHNDWNGLADSLAKVMSDETFRNEVALTVAQAVRDRYSLQRVLTDWDVLFAKLGVL